MRMGPDITSERLQLRPWSLDDVDAAYEIYSAAEVCRFIGMEPLVDTDGARDFILRVQERDRLPDRRPREARPRPDPPGRLDRAAARPRAGHGCVMRHLRAGCSATVDEPGAGQDVCSRR